MTDPKQIPASEQPLPEFNEVCTKREDRQHCNCWYDGKPCCGCGEAMTFGSAIQAMKDSDAKVRRAGWNGKGMWLQMQIPDANSKMGHPYIFMSDVNGKLFPWNPNQLDMLSNDWEICD